MLCGTGIYQLITTGNISSFLDFLTFMGLFVILMFPCIFFYKKDAQELISEE
jgi:hypothetical protein